MNGNLPSHARVVVIGGGAIGLSTLYHLAAAGIDDAVLLERKQLTCGTTWHSAAQVRTLRSTRNLTQLIQYSAELYQTLEAETGQSTGWRQCGSMSIATTADRLTHIKRQAALSSLFDIECHVIGSKEAVDLFPLMRGEDVLGAVYSPGDGRVNPSDLAAALAKGARAKGATIREETPVTGFGIENGRVIRVDTPDGSIACEAVALCAGLWSREVGRLAGLSLPLYATEHFYLLTMPMPGVEPSFPVLGDHDGYLYIREEVGGLLVGCFEPNGRALALADLPKDFAFDLLGEDWDHFEPMMVNAIHRIPGLAEAEARTLLNGPESFTPDGSPLLGPVAGVDGFFVGCAMNSMGIASAGGIGRALAHWIVEGHQPFDLWPVDARRFAAESCGESFLRSRIPEVLGDHYAIGYPGREPGTGRDLRRSPLHERLAENGADFGVRGGWERPDWYRPMTASAARELRFGRPSWHDEVAAEHRAAREGVVLFDQSAFGKLRIEGPDAVDLLQRICANNIDVPPGRIVYTPMLNERGGYESDLTVTRLAPDAFLLVTGAAQAVRDAHWIATHRQNHADVASVDVSGDYATLSLMGPKARDLLARVTPNDLANNMFPYMTSQSIEIAGAEVVANRISYAGELGWELYVPAAAAIAVYDALFAAGGDLGLRDAGMFALACLRIEKGYRAWGHDIGPDDTPFEAGLAFAVDFEKSGDFVGRERLMAVRHEPPSRRFLRFRLDDPGLHPLGDEPIRHDGRIVGQATSAAYGHTVGMSLVMGYAELEDWESPPPSGWTLEMADIRATMIASSKPFYDPKGARLKE